ncbi:MAG TPA: putative toxin-antitoxin system toxin component, PIN family, partial [Candidatus Nanoarchaeia archaeon]|nr:putative toxin-antitoxin system toxin component, PIN family [Candidatus Nanoarchaeia archaeon]
VPTEEIDIVKEDSDDNILFETAISGNAQYIVTQDKAVLKINNFRGIKVLKPEDFLRLFS